MITFFSSITKNNFIKIYLLFFLPGKLSLNKFVTGYMGILCLTRSYITISNDKEL